jgi:hypothetical protein
VRPRVPFLAAFGAVVGQLACHSAASSSSSSPAPATASQPRELLVSTGETFTARNGAAALHDFKPELSPVDSGGECVVGHTTGSGATVVQVYFPSRTAVRTQITITFDSVGRLVRVSDRWGIRPIPSTVGMTPERRDSTVRVATTGTRTTAILLDYAVDQGFAMNRGGGRPTDAIAAPAREIERLPQLGPPAARVQRARRLCGV